MEKPVAQGQTGPGHLEQGGLASGATRLVVDALALISAVVVAGLVTKQWDGLGSPMALPTSLAVALSAAFVCMSLAVLHLLRVQGASYEATPAARWFRVVGAVSFAAMFSATLGLLVSRETYAPNLVVLPWAISAFLVPVSEHLLNRAAASAGRQRSPSAEVIIVGSPENAAALKVRFERADRRYSVVGFVKSENGATNGHTITDLPILGSLEALPRILEARSSGEVLVAAPAERHADIRWLLDSRSPRGRSVHALVYPSSPKLAAEVAPFPQWQTQRFSWWYEHAKRAMDLALGCLALVLTAPVMAVIALLIKLDSPGPVFFRQVRVGRHGRLFYMYKFRSMHQDAESLLQQLLGQNQASGHMFKMRDDPRVTRVGRIIRRLSLDELPQVLNVVQGTMSLVGPRPPLPNEVQEYEPWHFQRLEAVPGMTGLWQVTRGPEISFEEMVKLDIEYVRRWSLWRDLVIILKTVPATLAGRGAY